MSWLSDHTLLTGATVAAATMGGVFWGFSTFIMKALDEIPVPQGVAAMQSINKFAPTPLFMIPLFGTAVVGIGLAVNGLARLDDPASKYKLLGAGIYLAGSVDRRHGSARRAGGAGHLEDQSGTGACEETSGETSGYHFLVHRGSFIAEGW